MLKKGRIIEEQRKKLMRVRYNFVKIREYKIL